MTNKELVKELYELSKQLRSKGNIHDASLINQAYLRLENLASFKEDASRVLGLAYKGY